MNGELNFEAIPFQASDGFRTLASEHSGFELEEEFGRRARSRSPRRGFVPRTPRVVPKRPGLPPVFGPGIRKKPPVYPPPFPPYPVGWPWGVAVGPFGVVPEPPPSGAPAPGAREPSGAAAEPYAAEPPPSGSEYVRWVQSALNEVLGLRLPLHGVADAATRSAIRSFQRREGLPIDGVMGPDTERALLAARSGASARRAAPGPAGPDIPQPSEPAEPTPASPAAEFGFEWENLEQEFGNTRKIAERAAIKSRIAAGQSDPNVLTDMVFFQRHPERRGRPLRAEEYKLVDEWKAILRNIVLPELAHVRPSAGVKVSDREVEVAQKMAAHFFPELGITLEQLLGRHQAEAEGIPIEVLLAFIRYEAGGQLNHNVTAGKWHDNYKKYSPSFYELGIFQTPAGDHGCTNEAGVKICKYNPPGRNVENSQFGKGWWHLTGTYPKESTWKNPTMQVRVGLLDLNSTADRVRMDFAELFPSKQSEWYLRMAVLYSFAEGADWTRAFLRKYKNELVALPEGQRWHFLGGKQAYRIHPKTKQVETKKFAPDNVDKKMALAAKLRAARHVTSHS